MEAHWKVSGVWSREKHSNKEILCGTPSSKSFTHGCAKYFGENKRDKDNQHGVELALLGFDCQVANRPHSTYDQPVAISLRPGITRNPKHLLAGTSLGFDSMKKNKYISEDERGGFKVAKVNLPLSDGRLRLFLEGKEDWLEGLLVLAKKKIKEEGL
jgi:hypothetical protein